MGSSAARWNLETVEEVVRQLEKKADAAEQAVLDFLSITVGGPPKGVWFVLFRLSCVNTCLLF